MSNWTCASPLTVANKLTRRSVSNSLGHVSWVVLRISTWPLRRSANVVQTKCQPTGTSLVGLWSFFKTHLGFFGARSENIWTGWWSCPVATRQSQGGHVLQHTLLHHRFTRGTSRCVEEDWDSKLIRKLFPEVINQLNEGRFEALLRWLPFVFYTVFGPDRHVWRSSITRSTSPALLMTKQPAILKPHHHYTCYKLQTRYCTQTLRRCWKSSYFFVPVCVKM